MMRVPEEKPNPLPILEKAAPGAAFCRFCDVEDSP
jgi:hypothetical protein